METQNRILCVFGALDRGGAETMCMNLYRAMDRTKIQFDFVKHTSAKGAYEDEILSMGGKIYEAPRYKSYNRGAYCKWWKDHLQQHPEHQIIHGHFFSISAIYFKVAKAMGRITVGHSHSTRCVGSALKRMTKTRLVRKAYKYTDVALACSRDAGEWMFPKMPYEVLNNAIETKRFVFDPQRRAAVRDQFGIASDALVLGTVGNLNAVKNPFFMIDLVKTIGKLHENVRFLWIGEGALREQIEAQLRQENLDDTVLLVGAREDVPDLLQAMDVFVFPSLWEGLGMAVVEAQAAGLACYCSENVPREAAVTSLCHFLPAEDPQTWAEKILQNRQPRCDTSAQITAAGYDVRQTAKRLEKLYDCCLNG